MDEKGIQMGGGRKNNGKKYCFPKLLQTKYIMKSDNLELVTVLELVSAAGAVVSPLFCLQSGSALDLRDLGNDKWGRYTFVPHSYLQKLLIRLLLKSLLL
jgi:hypothetical protein